MSNNKHTQRHFTYETEVYILHFLSKWYKLVIFVYYMITACAACYYYYWVLLSQLNVKQQTYTETFHKWNRSIHIHFSNKWHRLVILVYYMFTACAACYYSFRQEGVLSACFKQQLARSDHAWLRSNQDGWCHPGSGIYQVVLEALVSLHAMAAKEDDWCLRHGLRCIKTHCAFLGTDVFVPW